MNKPVVEVVLFRLQSEVSPKAFLKAAAELAPQLKAMPGFVRRELSLDESGQWVDMVYWDSLEQAQSAAETMMQVHGQHPFLASIDPNSITMLHVEPKMSS